MSHIREQVLRDRSWIWCGYNAPSSEAVDEPNRSDEMRQQRRIEYEQDRVRAHCSEAVRITPDFGVEALRNTLQAGQVTRDNLLDVFLDSQEFASQASFFHLSIQ